MGTRCSLPPPLQDPHLHVALQAVFTNSVFVMDWTRPVPIEEYFVPLDDRLRFPDYRACLDVMELRKCAGLSWAPCRSR